MHLGQGFDEVMNVVLDDSEEVWIKASKGKTVGSRNALGEFPLLPYPLESRARVGTGS